ncbi:hypothetical protein [Xanthobacter agilis]|jgi:hypothetical protein|uniref:hypothetical protein n=1 Tax=Xanthobacter agilis TaxID=47492 RepID=UPI00352107EA
MPAEKGAALRLNLELEIIPIRDICRCDRAAACRLPGQVVPADEERHRFQADQRKRDDVEVAVDV